VVLPLLLRLLPLARKGTQLRPDGEKAPTKDVVDVVVATRTDAVIAVAATKWTADLICRATVNETGTVTHCRRSCLDWRLEDELVLAGEKNLISYAATSDVRWLQTDGWLAEPTSKIACTDVQLGVTNVTSPVVATTGDGDDEPCRPPTMILSLFALPVVAPSLA